MSCNSQSSQKNTYDINKKIKNNCHPQIDFTINPNPNLGNFNIDISSTDKRPQYGPPYTVKFIDEKGNTIDLRSGLHLGKNYMELTVAPGTYVCELPKDGRQIVTKSNVIIQ